MSLGLQSTTNFSVLYTNVFSLRFSAEDAESGVLTGVLLVKGIAMMQDKWKLLKGVMLVIAICWSNTLCQVERQKWKMLKGVMSVIPFCWSNTICQVEIQKWEMLNHAVQAHHVAGHLCTYIEGHLCTYIEWLCIYVQAHITWQGKMSGTNAHILPSDINKF